MKLKYGCLASHFISAVVAGAWKCCAPETNTAIPSVCNNQKSRHVRGLLL